MDEYTADAFANRDEPLPLLTVAFSDAEASSSEAEKEGKRQRLKRTLSPSRLKEKVQAHSEMLGSASEGSASIQDRVFAKILQQIVPTDEVDSAGEPPVDRRSSKYVLRPQFSLPLMTSNFRRFNARIGIVFVFQNRLIRLFTWKSTTHTVSLLALYTFVCLDPYLLLVLPLATLLLFIMVPAFIARHPPPPPSTNTSSTTPYASYTYSGPALAPARTIKPAAETSKDFFRNMRDLQNSMADFAALHDALVTLIAPATNFSNEVRSSTLFLLLSILTTLLFISAHLFPWRLVSLLAGYTLIISGHPTAQTYLVKTQRRAERKAASLFDPSPSDIPQPSLLGITPAAITSTFNALSAITLDSAPETREVEIFELQHRPILPIHANSTQPPMEWTHHMFTPTPYDPLSPARIAGSRPTGTRFFEDVQPPSGWSFRDKKWTLDLDAQEWVQERLVVGVECDAIIDAPPNVSGINGGGGGSIVGGIGGSIGSSGDYGGWVWDLPPVYGGTRDEEVWLAYGDYDVPSGKNEEKKGQGHKKTASKDWEEGVRFDGIGRGRTGEWRRRRWVRVVKRVGIGASEAPKT